MRRVIAFNKELKKDNLYLKVTRCYRSQRVQKEWHYARMITWSDSEIMANVRAAGNNKEKAMEIKANALDLFKDLRGTTNDDDAKKAAWDLINKKQLGSNPVAAAEDDCPCGCRWPRSAHTLDPSSAIDANIYYNAWGPRNPPVVLSTSRPNQFPEYQKIKEAATKSGLVWGIDWNVTSSPYMPVDAIHFEMPGSTKDARPPFQPNRGSLPAWDLRNRSQGGQGSLAKGDSRKDLVKHLQEMLIALGYNLGSSGADGIFGSMTESTVKSFQSSHVDFNRNVLTADGLVGPLTTDSLNRTLLGKWYNDYTVPPLLVQYYEEVRTGKKVMLPNSL